MDVIELPFGPDFNQALGGGLKRGTVTVLTGQSTVGKSALAGQIAVYALKEHPVLFACLDTTTDLFFERIVRNVTDTPSDDIRKYSDNETMTEEERELRRQEVYAQTKEYLKTLKTLLVTEGRGGGRFEVENLRNMLANAKKDGISVELLVIDPVTGLFNLNRKDGGDLRKNVQALTGLAEEFETAILVVAYPKDYDIPINGPLEDLAKPSNLTTIATTVIYQDETEEPKMVTYPDEVDPHHLVRLTVVKANNGPSGFQIELEFNSATMIFRRVD